MFKWQGPTEYLVPSSERIWSEQKWYALTGRVIELEQKRTATFTSRFKMRLATSRASLWLRYLQSRSGVSFGKLYLAGRKSNFRFASGLAES
jgi:hypothetical protein